MATKKKLDVPFIASWILGIFLLIFIFGTMYILAQQTFRQTANDPQIQLAEDTAAAISDGQQISAPPNKIDIEKSLSTYVIIYDNKEEPVISTALLDNSTPKVPSGVLAYARAHGEDRVTWQPKKGVRSAIVVSYFKGVREGYVLVGRSLREIEKREENAFRLSFFGGILSVVVLTIGLFLKKMRS